MGATTTILLPAGRPAEHALDARGHVERPRRAGARQRGLLAVRAGALARRTASGPTKCPTSTDATREIERYLKRGAVIIAEQKFGVECDSPEMQRIYELAQEHRVPVLMHWQFEMYNYGFERFHQMLEKYPQVSFLGHAQTWWAQHRQEPRRPDGAVSEGAGHRRRPDRPLSRRLPQHVRRPLGRFRAQRADPRRGLHARLPRRAIRTS